MDRELRAVVGGAAQLHVMFKQQAHVLLYAAPLVSRVSRCKDTDCSDTPEYRMQKN
jgi:hypothetical protein